MLSEYPNAGQILRCLRDVLCHVLFLSKVSVAGMIQVMGSSRGVGIELVHHRAILDQLKIIQKVSFGLFSVAVVLPARAERTSFNFYYRCLICQ